MPPQFGFLELAQILSIAETAATLTTSGITAYSTVVGFELAKEQQELQEELARRKMALEEEMAMLQRKLIEIQAAGAQEQQSLSSQVLVTQIELEKAKVQYEIERLNREKEIIERDRQLDEEISRLQQTQLETQTLQLEKYKQELLPEPAPGTAPTSLKTESIIEAVEPFLPLLVGLGVVIGGITIFRKMLP